MLVNSPHAASVFSYVLMILITSRNNRFGDPDGEVTRTMLGTVRENAGSVTVLLFSYLK